MVRSVKMTWFQKSKKDPTPKLPKVFRKTRFFCTCTEFLGYSYIGLLANKVNKGCQMLSETGSLILTVPSCMSTK